MKSAVKKRIETLLGQKLVASTSVQGGYTPTARWVVQTDKNSFFVKVAITPLTAGMVRREIRAYHALAGPYLPRFIAAGDHEAEPLLIIEDLSAARWPPPWDEQVVEKVVDQIALMHGTTADLPSFEEVHVDVGQNWSKVARNPAPFLALGWVDESWLVRALPTLMAAEASCPTAGGAVCHMDIRSDNLCLTQNGIKLIDWPEACLGNPRLDLGFWLPSLAFEGGPLPGSILPSAPEIAAWVAGFFAARAGLPQIPDAPRVRLVQKQQLSTALPWAVRELELPQINEKNFLFKSM